MAMAPDGRAYTFEERRHQHLSSLITSPTDVKLDFSFDVSDMTQLLSFSEKLSSPALSLLTADTADARARTHHIEVVLAAAGRHVRGLFDASPFTKTLAGDDTKLPITPAVLLILLGELAWSELTVTASERPLHSAFAPIKGATPDTDWSDIYRSALQLLNWGPQYLRLKDAGMELCRVRYGYSEQSNNFDLILEADAVKGVLSPHGYGALTYLAAFQALMRYPKLQNLPVRFIAEEYKAREYWAALFNKQIRPEHLTILNQCLTSRGKQ